MAAMRFMICVTLMGVTGWHLSSAYGQKAKDISDLTEKEFKAATLSKIPPYIQWPEKKQPPAGEKCIFGILGKSPFDDGLLEQLLKDAKIDGRDLVVKTFEGAEDLSKCHILFVPADKIARWQELAKSLDTFGILTVGESPDFAKTLGGVFNLSLLPERKLEINPKNAKKAGLEINSKLLKWARIVK